MSSVDERIVEMRFDNQQFESGVQKSLKTLNDLKSGLNLEGSAKSFETLQQSANSLDLSGIASGVDAVSNRVTALGIAGDQVIRYLTNQFIQLGEAATRSVKSLTSDQIGVGFDKYERKIQSVQTIMNATGMTVDEVNDRLNKLNWFTDETSYSFTDMVDNIGKFTSSDVDLDVAVTSMIGIADAAGLAGASTADASHAMEGFSKAIAQGYMSRQNWQWIRTAHMDTAKFKESLIETAVEVGTLTSAVDKEGKITYNTAKKTAVSIADFESAMSEGWMTTEVMNKALSKFGGATEQIYEEYLRTGDLTSDIIERMSGDLDELGIKSFRASQEARTFSDAINSVKDAVSTGWMQSFEYIFGNKDEAVALWTEVANEMWDVFASSGERRNEILEMWHNNGGYKAVIDGIRNAWEGIKGISGAVKESIFSIFPALNSETDAAASKLVKYSKKFENFTRKFRDNYFLSEKYQRLFSEGGYLSLLESLEARNQLSDNQKQALTAYRNIQKIKTALGGLTSIVDLFKFTFKSIGKIFSPVLDLLHLSSGSFLDFAVSVGESITSVVNKVVDSELLNSIIDEGTNAVRSFLTSIASIFGSSDFTELIGSVATKVKELALSFIQFAGGKIQKGLQVISQFFDEFGNKGTIKSTFQSIKDFFINLWSKVDFQKIGANISSVFSSIIDFIKDPDFSKISDLGKKIWGAITGEGINFETIGEKIKGYTDKVKNAIKSIFENTTAKNIWGTVVNIFNNIKTKVSSVIASIGESLSNLGIEFGPVVTWFDAVKNKIIESLGKVTEFLSNINWGKIIKVGIGVGLAAGVVKILKTVFEFGKILRSFRWVGESISGFFDALATDQYARAIKKISKAALVFSVAIGLLTLSLNSIAKIPKDALIRSSIALGLLMVTLAGIYTGLAIMSKKEMLGSTKGATFTMLGMVASVLGIVYALNSLTKLIDNKNYNKAILELFGILSGLALLTAGLGYFTDGMKMDSKNISITMLGMVTSIIAVIYALKSLTKLIDNKNYNKAVLELFGILSGLALLTAGLGYFTDGMKIDSKNISVTMLGMVASIIAVIYALKSLTKLIDNKNYNKAVLELFGILSGLSLLTIGLGHFTKEMKLDSKNVSITMLGMVASVIAVIFALKSLTKLVGNENYGEAVWTLIGILAGLSIFTVGLGKFTEGLKIDSKNVGIAMLSMAAAVLIIVQSLNTLTKLVSNNNFDKSVLALTVILTVVTTFSILLSNFTKKSDVKVGPILAMAAAVAILTASLSYLTLFKFGDLMKGVVALGGLLLAFGTTLKIASVGGKVNFPTITAYVASVAMILAIGYEIKKLSDIPWQSLLASAGSISLVLAAFAVCMKSLQESDKKSFSGGSVLGYIGGLVAIWAIGSIIGYMCKQGYSWQSMLSTAVSISAVLLAIAGAVKITQGVKLGASLGGLVDVAAWILGLSILFIALSQIAEVANISTASIERVEMLGTMIGGFVGGIVGGIGGGILLGVTSTLPTVGENLANFIENVQPFLDTISSLPDGFSEKMDSFSTGILNLASADLKEAWVDLIHNLPGVEDSNHLATQLEAILPIVKSLDDPSFLPGIKNLSYYALVVREFTGDYKLNTASVGRAVDALNSMAEGVKGFADKLNEIGDVNSDAIDTIVQNIEDLKAFANDNQDDLDLGKVLGENIVSGFINAMVGMGATDSETIGKGFLNRIKAAFAMLSVAGDDEVSALSEFSHSIVGTLFDGIVKEFASEDMVTAFQDIASGIITGIENGFITNAADIFRLGKSIIGGIVDSILLPESTVALNNFATDLVTTISSGVSTSISTVNAIGVNIAQGLINGMLSMGSQVYNAGVSLGAQAGKGVAAGAKTHSPSEITYRIGEYIGQGLGLGMLSMSSYVNDSARMMSEDTVSFINSIYKAIDTLCYRVADYGSAGMNSIGVNAGIGLNNGIISQYNAAYDAGHTLSNNVMKGVKKGLDINSPSREMAKVGRFAGLGLSNGLLSMSSYVSNSAEKMVEDSILSVSSIFDVIDSALAGNLDYNPVITPVLDLSAVSYGASQIDGILNNQSSLKLAGEIQDMESRRELEDLLLVGRSILREIQNGSDLYFDDGVLAGRINRRLGAL